MSEISKEMIDVLIEKAKEGRLNAYTPYSHFKVGAAVLGTDGNIYTGCNIENASFGLTNCAERTAIFKMVSSGCLQIRALAVIGSADEPGESGPCGACRQVIAEFAESNDTPVIVAGQSGDYFIEKVIDLYPRPFTKFVPLD